MVKLLPLSGEQNHRCCYCQHTMVKEPHLSGIPLGPNHMTRDHVVPASYGGIRKYDNIVIACHQCNNLRGHLDAFAFNHLINIWFARDQTLWGRWYELTKLELSVLRLEVLHYQELHLRFKSKTIPVFEDRHDTFLKHYGKYLTLPRGARIAIFM